MQVTTLRRKLFLHGFRLWLALAVVLYSLLGFVVAPWILHQQLEKQVAALTGQTLTVESVRLNPWTLTLAIDNARLDIEDQQDAAGLRRLFVDFELASLWNRAWTFAELRLSDPYLDVVQRDSGNTLSRLLPPADTDVPDIVDEDKGTLPRIIVRRFQLESGRLGFRDATHPGEYATGIDPIDIDIQDLATVPELSADNRLVARTASGGRLTWTGDMSLVPLTARGRIEYRENLDILWRYVGHRLGFEPLDGSADIGLDFRFSLADGAPEFSASDLSVELAGLGARPPGSDEEVLALPKVSLAGGRVDWPGKRIAVAEISIESPRVRAVLQEDGALNLLELLRPTPDGAGDEQAQLEDIGAGPAPASPWSVQVDSLKLGDGEIDFEDRSTSPAFRSGIAGLTIEATGLSLEQGATADVDIALDVQTGGRIASRGRLGLVPLSFDLETTVDALALAPAEPYIDAVAKLDLEDGSASAGGRLALAADAGLTYQGSASLDNFSATDALSGEKFFAVGRASAEGLRFEQRPGSLSVDRVDLQAPFFRVFIAADGSTNLAAVLTPDDGASAAADADDGSASPPFEISIGSTEIAGGTANFTDNSLPIPFATGIFELGGTIGTISTATANPASIDLQGRVDEYGSVSVDGEFDLLSPASRSQLDVEFRNVAMPRLSPYTAKFAGRRIANGSLDLALVYRIDSGKLTASNEIVIDQLELGERVESADALDLPLGLAVALLKDSQGRITADIPVTGDLSDPQFSIGGVVAKALRNLLVSVVAAPFKILAGLVGGSADELDHVVFAAGSAVLSPPAEQTLGKLADAMARRPEIVLELPGVYATETDRQAIQAQKLEAAIAVEIEALRADENVAVAVRRYRAQENLFVARFSALRLEELEAAFTRQVAEGEQEPANTLDAAGYYGAIRNQLRQTFEVATDELETLARDRSSAVSRYLADEAGIDPGRVRIRGIKSDAAADRGEVRLPFELTSGR